MSDRTARSSPESLGALSPFSDSDLSPGPTRGYREGLPPTFRMRADAHYVEQLDAAMPTATVQYLATHVIDAGDGSTLDVPPSLIESIRLHGILEPLIVQRNDGAYRTLAGRKRLAAARAAGLRDVPCLVHHVADDRARLLREALAAGQVTAQPAAAPLSALADAHTADALSAVMTSVRLLSPPTPSLARGVAADLVRAETWRAYCLLQTARIVRGEIAKAAGRVFPGELARRVVASAETECRLRGLSVATDIDSGDARAVAGDVALLHHGLSSLLLSTIALIEGVPDTRLALVSAAHGDMASWAIEQNHVVFDSPSATSDGPSRVDPRLAPLWVSITALRRIAEIQGGRLLVSPAGTGMRTCLELPFERERE